MSCFVGGCRLGGFPAVFPFFAFLFYFFVILGIFLRFPHRNSPSLSSWGGSVTSLIFFEKGLSVATPPPSADKRGTFPTGTHIASKRLRMKQPCEDGGKSYDTNIPEWFCEDTRPGVPAANPGGPQTSFLGCAISCSAMATSQNRDCN